jgi:hypothetical protein
MSIRQKRQRSNLAGRFFLLMFGVCALSVAAMLAFASFGTRGLDGLGAASPDLNPAERAMLTAYLATRSRELTTPAGMDPTTSFCARR